MTSLGNGEIGVSNNGIENDKEHGQDNGNYHVM